MRATRATKLSKAIENNGVKQTILKQFHSIQDLKHQYEEELAQLRSRSQCNNFVWSTPQDPGDSLDGGSGAPSFFFPFLGHCQLCHSLGSVLGCVLYSIIVLDG